jgi:hypothetical protein
MLCADDFEVSIFITETSTRHSLLYKHKHFHEKAPSKLQSNSDKLINATNDTPVVVDSDEDVPILLREDSEDAPALEAIPSLPETTRPRRSKRQRGVSNHRDAFEIIPSDEDDEEDADDYGAAAGSAIDVDYDSDAEQPPNKRRKRPVVEVEDEPGEHDDKKKIAMDVSYEGFAIYGRVLCLVVKKRETLNTNVSRAGPGAATTAGASGGQAMMENWISSTQMPAAGAEDEVLR